MSEQNNQADLLELSGWLTDRTVVSRLGTYFPIPI